MEKTSAKPPIHRGTSGMEEWRFRERRCTISLTDPPCQPQANQHGKPKRWRALPQHIHCSFQAFQDANQKGGFETPKDERSGAITTHHRRQWPHRSRQGRSQWGGRIDADPAPARSAPQHRAPHLEIANTLTTAFPEIACATVLSKPPAHQRHPSDAPDEDGDPHNNPPMTHTTPQLPHPGVAGRSVPLEREAGVDEATRHHAREAPKQPRQAMPLRPWKTITGEDQAEPSRKQQRNDRNRRASIAAKRGNGDGQYRVDRNQVVSGLTIGDKYDLSFDYAYGQEACDGYWCNGATNQTWQVYFGSESYSPGYTNGPEHGFRGWYKASTTFTATSTSQTLRFLAIGPGGQPPMALLDGVSLTSQAVPGPLPVMGLGATFAWSARMRKRIKQANRP